MTGKPPEVWRITNGMVELGVLEVGAQLGPVEFRFYGRTIAPMHVAPWSGETGATPLPMLRYLRGDFFCAPFGASDVLAEETRDHGLTANGRWRLLERSEARLSLQLEGTVSGAKVFKEIRLEPGQSIVYQRHTFEGGEGELPMGHHAMLRAPPDEELLLSFSPFAWAGTPPQPVESDPILGRSMLEYPQEIESLERVTLAAGGHVDLSRYPALEASEEIVMLATDEDVEIAWSAAVAPESRWLWFALRPNRLLRSTMLWMSNGGRDYPPFSGGHTRVVGIEEVTSFFHLGHAASIAPNGLDRRGVPTTVRLSPASPTAIDYAFGTIPLPPRFGRVHSLRVEGASLQVRDEAGFQLDVPFDADWPGLRTDASLRKR